jgi:hypothetical protein
MFRKFSRALMATTMAMALAACASSSLSYSGLVTASPEESHAGDEPTRRVVLRDRVTVVTHVASMDGDSRSGQHLVRWNWYEGQTLIAEQNKTLDFPHLPYRFSRSLAASDLGIGHYRVEVLVDGVRVDEQSFDVVAN